MQPTHLLHFTKHVRLLMLFLFPSSIRFYRLINYDSVELTPIASYPAFEPSIPTFVLFLCCVSIIYIASSLGCTHFGKALETLVVVAKVVF